MSSTVSSIASQSREAGGQVVLEFERVTMAFGTRVLFRDVSFQVQRGATKVLLGEAATGKTTILKLVLGLLRPVSGRVRVLGHDVTRMPERELFELRRSIGMAFQESALFSSLSVRENVAYRLEEEGKLGEGEIEQRVRRCLDEVELGDVLDKLPADLSGGMQHRVSIARALATEPEIMLYDSPTGGLDPVTSAKIMQTIIQLRDLRRVTALLVTHRLQDGYLLASQRWDEQQKRLVAMDPRQSRTTFLLLCEGRVCFDGTAEELLRRQDPYLRRYLA